MEHGICLQSVIPVRSGPDHRTEMVTQLLFGELYEITGLEEGWIHIRAAYDGYEGWIHRLQSRPVAEEEYRRLNAAPTAVTLDLVQLVSNETEKSLIPVLLGSSLPGLEGKCFTIGEEQFIFEGHDTSQHPQIDGTPLSGDDLLPSRLTGDASLYLNAPYQWGGRSPFGLDCSGFTQMIFKLHGIPLLRDAVQQATQGEVVALLAEAAPGDLAFFDDAEGNITHVGMLLDRRNIIHCSGQVRIDPLDHQGIYHAGQERYTHNLRLIRRII